MSDDDCAETLCCEEETKEEVRAETAPSKAASEGHVTGTWSLALEEFFKLSSGVAAAL